MQSNVERVQAAQAAREFAQKQLEAEQSKFEVGMSTNYFVVQAQRDLATAQNNELQAILAYRRSLVELERLQQTSLTTAEHHDSRPIVGADRDSRRHGAYEAFDHRPRHPRSRRRRAGYYMKRRGGGSGDCAARADGQRRRRGGRQGGGGGGGFGGLAGRADSAASADRASR